MKKKNSVILSIILSIIVLFNSTSLISVSAGEIASFSPSDDVITFITDKDRVILNTYTPLYSIKDEVVAYYFDLSPRGYAICSTNGNIIECSIEHSKELSYGKTYYLSPTMLCSKRNGKYYVKDNETPLLLEDEYVLSNSFSTKIDVVNQYQNSSALDDNISPQSTSYNYLSGTLRTYDYNVNGTCGSTAAAILLMYYNDYIDDYMVLSSYETSTGQSLIDLLIPYIDGDTPGSTYIDIKNGLNWYLRWKGRSDVYVANCIADVSFSSYKSIIDSGRPAVVTVYDAPTYGDHGVVGYGYETYKRNTTTYCLYVVNDGWGNNNIFINADYAFDIVYLDYL